MKLEEGENRTPEQLKTDFELEKKLAEQLKNASVLERPNLYRSVYQIYYQQTKLGEQTSLNSVKTVTSQLIFLIPFLQRDQIFVEIGPGDCQVLFKTSLLVEKTIGLDVSTFASAVQKPENCELINFNGLNIPLADNEAEIVYSHQMMEHLHPDDALAQLKEIIRVLKPGGKYICLTPNKLSGPHDISKYFSETAQGLHLKEYTATELIKIFKAVGFKKISCYFSAGSLSLKVPTFKIKLIEAFISLFKNPLQHKIARLPLIKQTLGIKIVAEK